MSDASKAVFLSYASQDAEAAKKICDALRAAGVEVWFDAEGGLEHGDEWDRKIRRQIKECVLFLAVISAHTQAREEGYFRLEWDMAAERARSIASGVAFILPVVIDGTREADALVPDRFRAVQWTRLPGGVVPPDVLQRFLKLWSHRTGALKAANERELELGRPRPAERGEGSASPPAGGLPQPGWKVYAGLALACLAIAAGAIAWLSRRAAPPPAPAAVPAQAATPQTEAQKLVARMQEIYDKGDDSSNDEWALAEELGEQATKVDPLNAEAWAAYSNVVSMPYIFGFDYSPGRLARATKAAERAMTLDPGSVAARLALANCRRLEGPATTTEADAIIRQLLAAQPNNWQVLRMAGNIFRTEEKYDEAIACYDRAAAESGNRPFAIHGKCRTFMITGRFAEAEAILDQLLARNASPVAAVRKIGFQLYLHDDLDAAETALAQVSPAFLSREEGAEYASTLWLWRRNADQGIAALARFGGDTLRGVPKGLIAGDIYHAVQRESAAQVEWQAALQKIEQRLVVTPNDLDQLYWKATCVALLGRKPEAEKLLETREQLRPLAKFAKGSLLLSLGRPDEALDLFEASTGESLRPLVATERLGNFRHNPVFDPLRDRPRFQAMVAQLAAKTPLLRPATSAATDNSVAVLPFANLSGDPAQEYFSDGLTEEILNALARERDLRVPGRSSSFSFKGKNLSAAEIARALNVTRLVEGSVRKSGNRVRISVSVTRASDGFSEEIGTFTEELADIFALEDKVARTVVEKLTRRTITTAVAMLTKNPAAYDAYLRGRALQTRSAFGAADAVPLYEQAVALDPEFALAWARLAEATFRPFGAGENRGPELVAATRVAFEHALALQPDLPAALIIRAAWTRYVLADYAAAQRDLARAESLEPATGDLRSAQGVLARDQGNWTDAFRFLQESLKLDPNNGDRVNAAGLMYQQRGNYVEADRLFARAMILQGPSRLGPFRNRQRLRLIWRGPEAALRLVDRIGSNDPGAGISRGFLLFDLGRTAEAQAALAASASLRNEAEFRFDWEFLNAAVAAGSLDQAALGARVWARQLEEVDRAAAVEKMARGNRAPQVLGSFVYAEICLGHRESALRELAAWRAEAEGVPSDYRRFVDFEQSAAQLYAELGMADEAVALLRQSNARGFHCSYTLRFRTGFAAIRNDPRFQELMKEEEAWAATLPEPVDP